MKHTIRLIFGLMLLPLFLGGCSGDDYVASVTDLRLVSITPPNVYAGDLAKILGRNFSPIPAENIVTVEGKTAQVIEATKDDITIIIPAGVEPGKHAMTVKAPSGEATGLEVVFLKTPLHQYIVQTAVGKQGVNTCEDGPAGDATVGNPTGVNIAPNGDLYFTDRKNNKIRRLDSDGNVTTVSHTGAKAVWQGAFDSKGTYFFADKDGKCVYRVNSDGSVSVALDGLTGPMGVAFDKNDKMYVAERDAFRLTTLTADGQRATITVGEKGHGPMHVEIAPNGDIYVTRQSSYCIDRVAPDGTITRIAGTGEKGTGCDDGDDGNPLSASVGHCFGFSFAPDGNLYFADSSWHTIRCITPGTDGDYATGTVTTIAGTGKAGTGDGKGLQAAFNTPYDVVMTPDCSTIYVTDVVNQLIRRITVR